MLQLMHLQGGTNHHKAQGVVDTFNAWTGTVLDVGCRTRELQKALEGKPITYRGLDLQPPADIVANLDEGLPLEDGSVDTLVALDVLEHTERIHDTFAECCRVARTDLIVSLPNCYDIAIRARVLRGRPISEKYGLPVEPPGDRHRWVFNLTEGREFLQARGELAGWRVVDERVTVGPRRGKVGKAVLRWPNLLGTTLMVHLQPR